MSKGRENKTLKIYLIKLRSKLKVFKVFINGYGIIGSRLATAVSKDKSIKLIGIAKYSPDGKTEDAIKSGFNVFVPKDSYKEFRKNNFDISGSIEDAILEADLVIDASSEGNGYKNKKKYYLPAKKKAIFQGGEDRYGEKSVADMIHNSRVNYEQARKKDFVIQGSCNVTGMGKIIQPLVEKYGKSLKRFDVNLIRRWADLEDKKEVKDSIEWDKNPHHQEDLKDFIPKVNLFVDALKVPSRMMHLHQMTIRFRGTPPSKDEILELFQNEFGVAVLKNVKGTGELRKQAIELGFEHGDTSMVHIHDELIRVQDDILKISYSDDQTGMVIPENYMLIQGMLLDKPREEALKKADRIFRINRKKKILERKFRGK
ncbi:type II glyceraldehyde-3-phosphate dehydrogenase [Candidatus Nitrosocosmicus sp. SS]|uniref:type II glyceraldehyde-3-phosphate dehydrogenase n=1 Tax=Candidatus Nitrosocosmicus agrestis TaxID=2563600 RepID=UPI001E4573EB|nr:type II glyceraldehyde-3-phosphate dehydrogenase [Candidatus Nitrosocosmicus sp. SS]MDR4492155.1 type II glyceraldehyde-3-phosphate dehydrogenase [Candidatus Nitrosocosmicus sp.]